MFIIFVSCLIDKLCCFSLKSPTTCKSKHFIFVKKVSETWIYTSSVIWVVQAWVSTWGYSSCALLLKTRKWRKRVIILCYFILLFFCLCIYILLYHIMSWCRYAVQLWKVGDTCFSDSQEQGWWIMEYAPFKQKNNLMFGEVRTLNLHCGIKVAKQRGVSYWCYVTTRTAAW